MSFRLDVKMAADDGRHKSQPGLSKNVKQMKFMQRKLDRDVIEESKEQDRQHKIDDDHWVLDLPELKHKMSKYEIEASYVKCEDLMWGRMSFKGMDPLIEKMMKNNEAKEEEDDEEEVTIDSGETMITDEEMAKQYSTLVETIGKKFGKKRNMSTNSSSTEKPAKKKKKKGFLKPAC
ncbi:M-phase phosphoprotein 6-like [Anneissia japonica]|uniref:M-phase phosphoprotein 6-like n=1 Tax=Anneissia japonica TaxID=1529436 RepID=UPI001425B218|nr:M-phase phosphoprotein 6-like [Anneissia japonica]